MSRLLERHMSNFDFELPGDYMWMSSTWKERQLVHYWVIHLSGLLTPTTRPNRKETISTEIEM